MGRFFPDIADKDRRDHFYPPPLSMGFWVQYAEPLSSFLETATLFADTLQNLDAEVRDGESPIEVSRRELADRALFSFLAGCMPVLSHDPQGARRRAFHSKSLLASLAMMAYLDLTSGKRVGRPFVSGAYQARYCSDRCRNRALKRERHRDQDPAAEIAVSDDDVQRTSA